MKSRRTAQAKWSPSWWASQTMFLSTPLPVLMFQNSTEWNGAKRCEKQCSKVVNRCRRGMDLWKPVFGLPPRRGSMGRKGRPIRRKIPCQAPMTPNRSKEPDKTSRLTNRRPDYSWRNDDHCSPVTAHTRCQARAHSRKRRGPELERLGTRTSGRGRPDRISRRWRAVRGLPEDVVLQFAWLFQLDLQLLGQPWLVKRSVLQ